MVCATPPSGKQFSLQLGDATADGRHVFRELEHQLPLTEPSAHNAIRGRTRWAAWHLVSSNGHSITLQCLLHARPGHPLPVPRGCTG